MVEAAAEAAAEEVVDLVVEEVVEDGKYYSVYAVNDMRRNEIKAFIHLMITWIVCYIIIVSLPSCLIFYFFILFFLMVQIRSG